MQDKIAIIGYGYVGKAMQKIFPGALLYDKRWEGGDEKAAIIPYAEYFKCRVSNRTNIALVCVPTPSMDNGEADISAIEEVLSWLQADLIIIKSTVPPGTCAKLTKDSQKNIVFSPEFCGESKYFTPPWLYPDPSDPRSHDFAIFGGPPELTDRAVDIYMPRLGPHVKYFQTNYETAELVKYVSNAWGATKITFCNEIAKICEVVGVDYNKLREVWMLDPRVERMHTAVFKNDPGFAGKCFPKDLLALISLMNKTNYSTKLLTAVRDLNEEFRNGK